MPLELLDLFGEEPAAPAPVELDVTPARLVALLRWRTRAILRGLSVRLADAVRLVPALLAASSPHRSLRGEPPGVAARLRPVAIAKVTRAFGLPPPGAAARRRLVRAILLVPGTDAPELRVCVDASTPAADRASVQERLTRIQEFLATHGLRLPLTLEVGSPLDDTGPRRLAVLSFGGLLDGSLPESPLRMNAPVPASDAIVSLAADAPTALARLGLLALAASPRALDPALNRLLTRVPSRVAANPDALVEAWLGDHPAASAFTEARHVLGAFGAGRGVGIAPEGDQLVSLGRRLSVAALHGVRRAMGAKDPRRASLVDDALGGGLPKALWPVLKGALAGPSAYARVPLELPPSGLSDPVVYAGRVELARARTPELAVARGVVLAARVLGEAPPLGPELDEWRAFAAAIATKPMARETYLLLDAEPARALPADPLNAGPGRHSTVSLARVVAVGPGRRPTVRSMAPDTLAGELAMLSRGGTKLVPLVARPGAVPAVARIAGLLAFARGVDPALPLAVESAGIVTLVDHRVRRFSATVFARRPRRFEADPDAPDLPFESLRRARARPGAVSLRLTGGADGNALVTCTDVEGRHVALSLPVGELAAQMGDIEQILRTAGVAVLVTTDPALALATRRAGLPDGPVATLRVVGGTPLRPVVRRDDELFGAATGLGFRALAEAVLSGWPPGTAGVLRVAETSFESPAAPVLRLWTAAWIRRRVLSHIAAIQRGRGGRP